MARPWRFVAAALLAMLVGVARPPAVAGDTVLNGAGATFPYPLYARWAYEYRTLTGVKTNYQSIGSGGGIAQIKAGTVDFGASDAPMKPEELEAAGLVQFPIVIGGVAPVVNLPGVPRGALRLTAETLAGIFLGRIRRWNHPSLQRLHPALPLSDLAITVVHRADASGTTWIFTRYLDEVSHAWHGKAGNGKAVAWPVGIGGKGNEGVAAYVQRIPGAIGYVEYAYALQNRMDHARMRNRSGLFVSPRIETFEAAAAHVDWKNLPGYFLVLTNRPGEKAWPLTGASFILVYREQTDAVRTRVILSFFAWCYRHGRQTARELHYVPIPLEAVDRVERTWHEEIRVNGEPGWP